MTVTEAAECGATGHEVKAAKWEVAATKAAECEAASMESAPGCEMADHELKAPERDGNEHTGGSGKGGRE